MMPYSLNFAGYRAIYKHITPPQDIPLEGAQRLVDRFSMWYDAVVESTERGTKRGAERVANGPLYRVITDGSGVSFI